MLDIEQHRLMWAVDKAYSSDVGRCICDWRMWSKHHEEIVEGHKHHLEFLKRKQQEETQAIKKKAIATATSLHEIRWNATLDYAHCSFCNWKLSGLSMAKISIAFEHHVQDYVEEERTQ